MLQDSFLMHGMNNLYNMISFSADMIFQREDNILIWQDEFGVIEYHLFSQPMKYMV